MIEKHWQKRRKDAEIAEFRKEIEFKTWQSWPFDDYFAPNLLDK